MESWVCLYTVTSWSINIKFLLIHLEYTLILKSTSRKLKFSNIFFFIHSSKKNLLILIELVLIIVGQICFCFLFFNLNLLNESSFFINGKSKITSKDFLDISSFFITSNLFEKK